MSAIRKRPDGIHIVATVFTLLTVVTMLGIFLFLLIGSIDVFRQEGAGFFYKNHWSYRKSVFQAGAMIYGTAVVSLIATAIALPVGLATALFTSEICPERYRLALKLLVELLAGVPSVVYGLIGVLFVRNWMAALFERAHLDIYSGDTLLTAAVLLAVMVLPTMATLFDDAFRSVGARYRDGARALGMTRAETAVFVLLPKAAPALSGTVLLSLGRALGETIAVFLVVGRADNRLPAPGQILHSLIEAGQTITSKLGGAETNIAIGDKVHTSAMLGLALVLFVAVAGLTLGSEGLRARLSRGEAR